MKPVEIAKPLGVFALVIVVIVGGTAVASVALGPDTEPDPDSRNVQGQSPGQFQPDRVNPAVDPETGNLSVTDEAGHKRILIDSQHANRYERHDLEPVIEALSEAGHDVDYRPTTDRDVDYRRATDTERFGRSGGRYNATLRSYDAVLVIFPTTAFTESERVALRNYTEGGGRVVVLAEPTQVQISGAFAPAAERVTFGATEFTWRHGVRTGAEALYNIDDDGNDNNFRSVDAHPVTDDNLTAGVDEITFDYAGYAVVNDSTDAEVLFTASDGTRTLDTRREGSYPMVVRNDNVVFVSDSNFIKPSELYDADNEVFVGNLLDFLVTGDKPDEVPAGPHDDV